MRIEKHSYSEQEQNRPKKDVVHNVDIVARLAPLRVTSPSPSPPPQPRLGQTAAKTENPDNPFCLAIS